MNTKARALQNEIAAHTSYVATASALGLASKSKLAKHRRHVRACMQELNRIDPIPDAAQLLSDDQLLAELGA